MEYQRVLRATPATITATFLDQNGETQAPSGAVTVTLTKADGTAVVTDAATTSPNTGEYAITLTAAQTATLDQLTATWTAASGEQIATLIDIVGGFYFSIAYAQSVDRSLGDLAKYPVESIIRVRNEVEVEMERITGRAWVPRFRQFTFNGNYYGQVAFPDYGIQSIRYATANGVAISSTITSTWLTRTFTDSTVAGSRITVGYEHGETPVPADLRRAMVTRLRHRLNADKSGIPDRATSFASAEGGTFSLSTPGVGNWHTGIPEVDEVYNAYRVSGGDFASVPIG